MIAESNQMTKRQQSWPVTPENKRWARSEMERQGITQDDLGARVGCSGANISQLLSEERDPPIRNSTYWYAIVVALGGTPPTITDPSAVADEESDRYKRIILENWDTLSIEDRATVARVAAALTKKR